MNRGIQYAPTSVIRQLVMPMRLPQARDLPDPEAYHRIVVCAAYGNGAFSLVHWLAQQNNCPRKAAALPANPIWTAAATMWNSCWASTPAA
jgi:hypothetical protein